MSGRRRPLKAGLTLVEFLFAASVMAMVGLGVVGMFPSAFRSVVSGGQVTKAANLALEMVNMIRNEPFDNLYLTPSSGNGYTGYSSFNTSSLPGTCPPGSGDSCSNKMKWGSDLSWDSVQSSGRGLPWGSGAVSVTCLAPSSFSPYTPIATTCDTNVKILRVSVTVSWTGSGSQSVNLITYVARNE